MLKVISSEKFSFQSYQNKINSELGFDTMNLNANSADVRRLTMASWKVFRVPCKPYRVCSVDFNFRPIYSAMNFNSLECGWNQPRVG